MNSIDLLSLDTPTRSYSVDGGGQAGTPSQNDLEQISEETTNRCDEFISAAAGSPSLLSSSSEQQSPDNHTTIYQLDFDVEHLGKHRPQSKRVAVWKYGLPNESAVKGMHVAGHEVELVWSTHSGKYTISVDGGEVFSKVAKGSVLEHKWKWSHSKSCITEDDDNNGDCVAMRIIACRKPPVRSSKDFRCYEFIIGGKLYRDLPVYLNGASHGGDFQNEEQSQYFNDGKLKSILDIIEPGWKSEGFA